MRDYQKYAAIVAVFAAVLYAALIVAAFGLISLVTNLDVISAPDAGPLLGPSMAAAAALVVFVLMLLLGLRTRPENQRIAVGDSLGTGFAAFASFVLVGAILFALNSGPPADGIAFAGSLILGPFAATVGILGFIVTLLYSMVLASRMPERGRPLWPWERRDD
jgi:hypothetical protein